MKKKKKLGDAIGFLAFWLDGEEQEQRYSLEMEMKCEGQWLTLRIFLYR